MSRSQRERGSIESPPRFATTRWSVVLAAARSGSLEAREALDQLCRNYWYPLYAYVRRLGNDADEAHDLTQAFFARVLEKRSLKGVDRRKGKFRSFLLASLRHFLSDEWDKARAGKRGGAQSVISLDGDTAEDRYRLEPVHSLDAEKLFERRWVLTLLEQVLLHLEEEYVALGKKRVFATLCVFLPRTKNAVSYSDAAVSLEMTEGAVKVAVHRLRQRYREILRLEIARTVAGESQVEDEIRHFFAVLGE